MRSIRGAAGGVVRGVSGADRREVIKRASGVARGEVIKDIHKA